MTDQSKKNQGNPDAAASGDREQSQRECVDGAPTGGSTNPSKTGELGFDQNWFKKTRESREDQGS